MKQSLLHFFFSTICLSSSTQLQLVVSRYAGVWGDSYFTTSFLTVMGCMSESIGRGLHSHTTEKDAFYGC